MANLSGNRGWLRDDAAASIHRLDAQLGRLLRIASAGRTVAEQNEAIARWDRGGAANRPPYLYEPARPAETSSHVKDGGVAVDTPDIEWMLANGPRNGWTRPYNWDVVHFVYNPANDQARPGGAPASVVTLEQQFLVLARGESLAVDGIKGPATVAAYKRYQEFLRAYGYTGAIDGEWGAGTQAAHAVYYAQWDAARNAPAAPSAPEVSLDNIASIGDVRGLQKVARLYGYRGAIDNAWGPGSKAGFAKFLQVNYGGMVRNWLIAKYGYSGDNRLGPNMTAALQRANAANLKAL